MATTQTARVRYTGPTQHTRILTTSDLIEQIGVPKTYAKEDLQWDLAHGHVLTIDEAHDTLLDFFRADPSFEIVGDKESKSDAKDEAGTGSASSEGDASGSATAAIGTPNARSTTPTPS